MFILPFKNYKMRMGESGKRLGRDLGEIRERVNRAEKRVGREWERVGERGDRVGIRALPCSRSEPYLPVLVKFFVGYLS